MPSPITEETMNGLIHRKRVQPFTEVLLARGFHVDVYTGFTRTRKTPTYCRDYVHMRILGGKLREISLTRTSHVHGTDGTRASVTHEWDSHDDSNNGRCPSLPLFVSLLDALCPDGDTPWA